MEAFLFFLVVILIMAIVLPIMAMSKASGAAQKVDDMQIRLARAVKEIEVLKMELKRTGGPAPSEGSPAVSPDRVAAPPPRTVLPTARSVADQPRPQVQPPPMPLVSTDAGTLPPVPEPWEVPVAGMVGPEAPGPSPAPKAPALPTVPLPKLNLEQFLGVKLFAWLGGLALFFAIVFFVKYSFDHNLIPPAGRVAIGFVLGAGLLVAGVMVHRKQAYKVLAQTFCASGTLILYGVSFSAHTRYHLFGDGPGGALITFGLMALTTVAAFLISVRLNALVVAVLGMLGGFLTPILCSTGQDAPFGLFGYIALLNLGLLMVARTRQWFFLASLAAAGTILMQVGWFARFFVRGEYFTGTATLIPMGITLFFMVLFAGAAWWNHREASTDHHPPMAALAMAGTALLAAFAFLGFEGILSRPLLLYGFVFLVNAATLGLVRLFPRFGWAQTLFACLTLLHQLGWFSREFVRGEYFTGTATLIPMGITLGFLVLFGGVGWWNHRKASTDDHSPMAALVMAGTALLVSFAFLEFEGITSRPLLLYGFVFLVNAATLGLVVVFPRFGWAQTFSAGLTFLHLGIWTTGALQPDLLGRALVIYLVFGLLHAGVPMVWQQLQDRNAFHSKRVSPWISVLVVLLMLLPVLVMPEVSFLLWPALLLADLGVVAVAVITGILAPVLLALVLTLLVVLSSLLRVPPEITALPSFLLLLGGFAFVFALAGGWLVRRFPGFLNRATPGAALTPNDRVAASLPVMAAGLPFLLLIMVTLRLPVADPSPVFGLGLLMTLLLLGLARIGRLPVLSLVALVCMVGLELAWHGRRFNPEHPWIPLIWYAGVHLLFTVYPFLFRETFRRSILPWAAAAASGIGHFLLIYSVVRRGFPELSGMLGLVPAAFAVPGIISLLGVLRVVKSEGGFRTGQLAWFGGVALLFITLIFPIQLSRQWITVAWALEGAALIWLYHRVPQRGLVWTGLTLLGVVFCRLALNPAVLNAYPRGAMPILNWHLYTYGIAAASLMAAARWLPPPFHAVESVKVRPVLWSLAGILLFLLLNIEIADYFTDPGQTLVQLQFHTLSLARDMTTTVAWSLFSLALLVAGFWSGAKGARYAGVGLLAITLLKLFLHDLASLETFYRIGALVAVAVIALVASFLYQRFFDKSRNP